MKTFMPVENSNKEQKWFLIDADGQTLGHITSVIAGMLSGKNNPAYAYNVKQGDYLIVINTQNVKLSGNKSQDKIYFSHSGRPGGMRLQTADDLRIKLPQAVIEHAVKGMLKKSSLGKQFFKKLKLYAGVDHPHEAQNPIKIDLNI
jgi:large subunit ribosomal protein L13